MPVKNLAVVIVAHQPYVRHILKQGDLPGPEYDILFSSISQTYIPLVNLLYKFEEEGVNSKFSIVLSPSLCSMLTDDIIQSQYIEWLDRCIALGEREVERLSGDERLLKNAQAQLAKALQNKADFIEKYHCNLVKQFARFERKGMIEILGTCGSYIFLPHYADMPEILNAQIEAGIFSHKQFFGSAPDGFWLPFQGYASGVEKVLRSYGINYTVLDAKSLLFSVNAPDSGIFAPVRCWNSLVLFGSDACAEAEICSASGFSSNKVYRNQNRDAGFELDYDTLKDFVHGSSPRTNTLFRYWSNDENVPYDAEKALCQAKTDAKLFLEEKNRKLEEAAKYVENPCLVCALSARSLGLSWAEGIDFLEEILRQNRASSFVSPGELTGQQFRLNKVVPYPAAASGQGYGEDLLDSSNSWMLRYTRKMCERMVDMAGRFPDETGLKARLLNVGAKELMIAQSAELSKMLHDGELPDFAKKCFSSAVLNFTTVFDSLGTNLVSTDWLTKLEKEHNLFPWMNYRIFSRKI